MSISNTFQKRKVAMLLLFTVSKGVLLGIVSKTLVHDASHFKNTTYFFESQHFSIPLDNLERVLNSLIGFSGDQSASIEVWLIS